MRVTDFRPFLNIALFDAELVVIRGRVLTCLITPSELSHGIQVTTFRNRYWAPTTYVHKRISVGLRRVLLGVAHEREAEAEKRETGQAKTSHRGKQRFTGSILIF